MRSARLRTMVTCGCAVAIVGCGSTASKHSHGAAGSGSGKENGVASASPAQILADASAAIRSTHSFAIQGTMSTGGQQLSLSILTTGPKALSVSFSRASMVLQLIEVGKASYIHGNAAFWKTQAGPLAHSLVDRWIQVPPGSARKELSSLNAFLPATLARCLVEDHGTLSKAGTTTVDGHPAIVIKDAGNVPGSSPGELAVATTGAAYPLRATSTGPQRPGGHIDVCNNGKALDVRVTVTLSKFDQVPPIRAPAGALRRGNTPTV